MPSSQRPPGTHLQLDNSGPSLTASRKNSQYERVGKNLGFGLWSGDFVEVLNKQGYVLDWMMSVSKNNCDWKVLVNLI